MDASDVVELVQDSLFPLWMKDKERLDRIRRWYKTDPEQQSLPPTATREMRALQQLAKTPWLGLVVTTVAQNLYVDGYRSPNDASQSNATGWSAWTANDLDARQIAVHRAALAYGVSYMTVLPGQDPVTGVARPAMRGVSPRQMIAVYQDVAQDDWPMYAMRVEPSGKGGDVIVSVYDEEWKYVLSANVLGGVPSQVEFLEPQRHGLGVCPVVRYCNMLDLDGESLGEVEPFIPVAARINKTDFDRLLAQHFSSWRVRTISGMSQPDSDEEANRAKLRMRQDDILIAEDPDTKFGTLEATDLRPYVEAHRADVQGLAAVSQTPTTTLTGDMINLSAEALAEARAGLDQKVDERKRAFGKSHDQALRLAALIDGDASAAADTDAHVTWQDTSVRSMNQAVEALGKAAQLLGVPPQALWARIPGVSRSDVEEWKQMAEESDALSLFLQSTAQAVQQTQQAAQPDAED